MAPMPGVRRPLLIFAVPAVVVPLVAVLMLLGAAQPRRPARPPPPAAPQRTAQLDGPGLADLRMVRREARRQAHAVSTVVRRCVRDARRGALRACAFRPLAAAGAGSTVNGLILGRIGDRLTPGSCSRSVARYRALLMQFGMTADQALRSLAEQHGNLVASVRLGHAVERASRDGAWVTTCAPRLGDAPAA